MISLCQMQVISICRWSKIFMLMPSLYWMEGLSAFSVQSSILSHFLQCGASASFLFLRHNLTPTIASQTSGSGWISSKTIACTKVVHQDFTISLEFLKNDSIIVADQQPPFQLPAFFLSGQKPALNTKKFTLTQSLNFQSSNEFCASISCSKDSTVAILTKTPAEVGAVRQQSQNTHYWDCGQLYYVMVSLTLRCGLVCPLNLYAFTPKVWPLLKRFNSCNLDQDPGRSWCGAIIEPEHPLLGLWAIVLCYGVGQGQGQRLGLLEKDVGSGICVCLHHIHVERVCEENVVK
eukprot:TRINITY_DN4859_c0_g1_i2.p1 TRINITY_DN4859_c0_g1~~TRINITY_DN4859_c0_g1_i2.p1  ORF type:complete len:291 (-),score=24.02 TRINITY_DN4859_c0_g1_i2:60-932(-)